MSLGQLVKSKRDQILTVAAAHGAGNVRLFGSVARQKEHAESDIDFLVDMAPGRSLFDLGALLMDLEELLGRRVDVVTEKSLRPKIRRRVLREALPL